MLKVHHCDQLKDSLIDECVNRLCDGAVVVVEVQRLGHLIADQYNRRMLANGPKAWATPQVYTLSTWLGRLWSEHSQHSEQALGTLLSVGQAKEVWESVIARHVRQTYQSGYEYLLWHITATANHVNAAYALSCSYGVDIDAISNPVSADVAHFKVWLKAYQQVLTRRNCIDHERLPDHIGAIAAEVFRTEQVNVIFAGFETRTPQLNHLIASLESTRGTVELLEHRTKRDPASSSQLEFATLDEELDACARWTRAVMDANPENHRVGIVAPNLAEIRSRLNRKLSAYLNPDAVMGDRQLNRFSFHMTLGSALGDVSIVVDLMNLLELIRPQVPVAVMVAIVLSDRNKDWELECSARAKLAQELYQIGSDRLSLDDAIEHAKRSRNRCPTLLRSLVRAKRLLDGCPKTESYGHWGEFFMKWIENFQSKHKGDRRFGVDEWQAYESWVSVVQGLAELGFVAGPCKIETALAKLTRRVSESSVQPRAVRTPVQVGEYLSMAGQTFTHLWMLGMNEKNLPGSPQPNAFLPISLQKHHGIPMSSAATLNAQIGQRYARIVATAEHVVQSFARMDGAEIFQKSLFLLQPQPFVWDQCEPLTLVQDYPSVIAKDYSKCEFLSDWQAPALQLDGNTTGGSALLKDQSNCPFRAFATYRLSLKQEPRLEVGVTRLARGSMMHRLAEILCSRYATQDAVRQAAKSGELSDAIKTSAQSVVMAESAKRVRPFSEDMIDVEVGILSELANELMEAESLNPYYNVWAVEYATQIELAGMTLKLKIDRIDEYIDEYGAQYRLTDYKTGNCNLVDAIGERPKDPQLGVYALAFFQQDYQVADVAYIQLKDGQMQDRKSWWHHHRKYPKKVANIQNQISLSNANWKETLNQLAHEFVAGKAHVDPLPYACEYCSVASVCRIKSKPQAAPLSSEDSAR